MKPLLILGMLCCLIGCASADKRLARESTADLKLRHRQCAEFLVGEKKDFEFKFGPPIMMAMQGDPRKDRIEEKEGIERELLRRWRAGDDEAFLPIFGPQQ